MSAVAGCLVAMACARKSLNSIAKVASDLPSDVKLSKPVCEVVQHLSELQGCSRSPLCLTQHVGSFYYDDWPVSDWSQSSSTWSRLKIGLATCGQGFIFLTDDGGFGISKIGTGFEGTIQGFKYAEVSTAEAAFLTGAEKKLLRRPYKFDTDNDDVNLAAVIDAVTIKEIAMLKMTPEMTVKGQTRTLGLISDGICFFWVRVFFVGKSCVHRAGTKEVIFVDKFSVEKDFSVSFLGRVFLRKSDSDCRTRLYSDLLEGKIEDQTAGEPDEKDANVTSMGISLSNLEKSAMWTCGSFISVMPAGKSSSSRRTSQLPSTISHSLQTGMFVSCVDLTDPGPSCAFNKSGKINNVGAAYDPMLDKIFIATNGMIDVYANPSLTGLLYVQQQLAIPKRPDFTSDTRFVVAVLYHHMGLFSQFQARSSDKESSLAENTLNKLISLLVDGKIEVRSIQLSIISTIRYALRQVDDLATVELDRLIKYLEETCKGESCEITIETLSELYFRVKDHVQLRELISTLLVKNERTEGEETLLKMLLKKTARKLLVAKTPEEYIKIIGCENFVGLLFQVVTAQGVYAIESSVCLDEEVRMKTLGCRPQLSPLFELVETAVKKLAELKENLEEPNEVIVEMWKVCSCQTLVHAHVHFKSFIQVAKQIGTLFKKDPDVRDKCMLLLERSMAETLIGTVLSTVASSALLDQEASHVVIESLQSDVQHYVQLVVECRRALNAVDVITRKSSFDPLLWRPWTLLQTVQSSHPIKNNFNMKMTCTYPGTERIYAYFDPRCATQYVEDKLVVTGKSDKEKLGEFGGNSLGFGSKKTTWPTSPLVVEGNTLSFSYESHSERDEVIPDLGAWGFKVYVTPAPTLQEAKPRYLHGLWRILTSVASRQLRTLFEGTPPTAEEAECGKILQSKLLQQCIWHGSISADSPTELNTERLSKDVTDVLRSFSESQMPPVRKSVKAVIQPDLLEEGIISAIVKHAGLRDSVKKYCGQKKDVTLGESVIMSNIFLEGYHKLHALIRRLQALAELENQWENEVESVRDKITDVDNLFFLDYQHHESKSKELALLLFLKGIPADKERNLVEGVCDLREIFEKEVFSIPEREAEPLRLTRSIVHGILRRIELLLRVSIATGLENSPEKSMARSLQNWPGERIKFTRQQSQEIERCLDDSILQIPRLKKSKSARESGDFALNFLEKMLRQDSDEPARESKVLKELFEFIGSFPEQAVSAQIFLSAIQTRRQRSRQRIQALSLMKGIVVTCGSYGANIDLVHAITDILCDGPRIEQLTCSSFVPQVKDAFTETLSALVNITSLSPEAYKISVCQMCILPYTCEEEQSIVKSGIVNMVEKLCAMNDDGSNEDLEIEKQSEQHKLSKMAWGAFKVLANRCVEWEKTEKRLSLSAKGSSGLSQQVSALLSNYLIQASRNVGGILNCSSIQEALLLLTDLSESRLGQDILIHPKCVSKLLSLLVEPRLSPRMILTIARLCHVALPLMSAENCAKIMLPTEEKNQEDMSYVAMPIVAILMSKLTDFLVPGPRIYEEGLKKEFTLEKQESGPASMASTTVCIHSSGALSSHDLIQHLIEVNDELEIFPRWTGRESLEKVAKMDRELNKSKQVGLVSEEPAAASLKAVLLAQQGFITSLQLSTVAFSGQREQKERKTLCKKRNSKLSRQDPQRPFLSQAVANELAAEMIALLQSLLKTTATGIWSGAIYRILKSALKKLPTFVKKAESFANAEMSELSELYQEGKDIMAALSLLGCFKETIKEGSECFLDDNRCPENTVQIKSVNLEAKLASVQRTAEEKPILVPISRLTVKSRLDQESLQLLKHLGPEIVVSIQDLLIPDVDGVDSLSTPLPSSGEGTGLVLMTARVVSQVRTEACKALALYMRLPEAAMNFLGRSCHAVDMLKCLSKDCLPADRMSIQQTTSYNLRSLYWNCIKKQSKKAEEKETKQVSLNAWNPLLNYPSPKSCVFSDDFLTVAYHGNLVSEDGLPRGAYVYGRIPFSPSLNESYFEAEILSLGASEDESGTFSVAIGLSPQAERKSGNFNYPEGTILCHSNGKLVHYTGSSLLQWRSIRISQGFGQTDTVGIGWERDPSQENVGTVFVTMNGLRLHQTVGNVTQGMFPVVHITKKEARVRTNFGQQRFRHAEADRIVHQAQESCNLPVQKKKAALPAAGSNPNVCVGHRRLNSYPSRRALKIPGDRKEKNKILHYKLPRAHRTKATGGPLIRPLNRLDEDSDDDDDVSDDDEHSAVHQSINSLLVKAWETKVFPVIQRRFRNDAERNDGLEQIRGALSLGMTDIARQTVEFLYEENGGIPRDLHLPTPEDVREDMMKFTIDTIKKGDQVVIVELSEENEDAAEYATMSQMRTFGQNGSVLEVDELNELILVQSYLKAEGVMVRFWYPLSRLKNPHPRHLKGAREPQNVNIDSDHIHKEFINVDFALTRLYCRKAYLELLRHSRKPEFLQHAQEDLDAKNCDMLMSSVLMLRDIDIENLQHLSNEVLSSGDVTGNVLEDNISVVRSSRILQQQSRPLRELLYLDTTELWREIKRTILKANEEGKLLELTNQICDCLFNPATYFTLEELVVNDVSTLKSMIGLHEACFSVVIPRLDPSKDLPPDLRIEVQVMEGDRIRKNGLNTAKDVIQYPMTGKGRDSAEFFPPTVLATDLVRVSHSGGDDSSVVLEIHGIPQEYPLALAYISVMLNISVPKDITMRVAEAMAIFLDFCAVPILLKQDACTLQSLVLRALNHGSGTFFQSTCNSLYGEMLTLREVGDNSEYCGHLMELLSSHIMTSPVVEHSRPLVPSPFCKDPTPLAFQIALQVLEEFSCGKNNQGNLKLFLKQKETFLPPLHECLLVVSGVSPMTSEILDQIKSAAQMSEVFVQGDIAILVIRWVKKRALYIMQLRKLGIRVYEVDYSFSTGDGAVDPVLRKTLCEKILNCNNLDGALTHIFKSCYEANFCNPLNIGKKLAYLDRNSDQGLLGQHHLELATIENQMRSFFLGVEEPADMIQLVLKEYGKTNDSEQLEVSGIITYKSHHGDIRRATPKPQLMMHAVYRYVDSDPPCADLTFLFSDCNS